MKFRYTVYTLSCPLTGNIFYVGATRCDLKVRLSHHMCTTEGKAKTSLIAEIKAKGLKPLIEPLEYCYSHKSVADAEQFWITQLSAFGFKLCNHKNKKYRHIKSGIRYWTFPKNSFA
jgi:hypothetical protein